MNRIVYTRDDGCVSVICPAEGARLVKSIVFNGESTVFDTPVKIDMLFRPWPNADISNLTVDWAESEYEFVSRIAYEDVPVTLIAPPIDVPKMMHRREAVKYGYSFNETQYQIVSKDSIPNDRTFRDAWVESKGSVEHDLDKCKIIAHNKRRAARSKELAPLDVEATIPSKAAQVEAKRQVIRGKYDAIQVAIDACNDVASLKAVHDTYAGLVK